MNVEVITIDNQDYMIIKELKKNDFHFTAIKPDSYELENFK